MKSFGGTATILAAHLGVTLFLFWGPLVAGEVLYFRDISVSTFPDYVFVSRALAQGVWPLWYPEADGGRPTLWAYPVELLLLLAAGPRGALAVGPPLHVFVAMTGASLLGWRLGFGRWGAWAAGAVLGLGGYALSCVNVIQYLHALAWAPWVLYALEGFLATASRRAAAGLAAAAALQVSTLAGEILLQTALAAAFIVTRPPARRHVPGLLLASIGCVLLSAPVVLGARTLVEGTWRGAGFSESVAFSWSATPMTLVEAVLPRFFGDVHTFSDVGFWGQPFFSGGYPYLLSLYVGPSVLLLAARGRSWRLWLCVVLGILLALGINGPLALPVRYLLGHFKNPVKFFFLTALAISLLAGRGLHRAVTGPRSRPVVLLPGGVLMVAALLLRKWPDLPATLAGSMVAALTDPRARLVAARSWPEDFFVSGALCLGTGLALWGGGRSVGLAGVLAALDLMMVNGRLNPSTAASFYDLQPNVQALVQGTVGEGPYRWFSFGTVTEGGLRWDPRIAARNSDVWLYYVDRQTLTPRTHVLDGLEGAFDEDRTAMAPLGSTLSLEERTPGAFAAIHPRLRTANIRWVVSLESLPEDLVRLRGMVQLPQVTAPFRLYELLSPLPRAYWAEKDLQAPPPAQLTGGESASGPANVTYERLDPHSVRLRVSGPPGYVVVLDGYHRYWTAEGPRGKVQVLRVNGRAMALATEGGRQELLLRYQPPWKVPAYALLLLGGVLLTGIALSRDLTHFGARV